MAAFARLFINRFFPESSPSSSSFDPISYKHAVYIEENVALIKTQGAQRKQVVSFPQFFDANAANDVRARHQLHTLDS